MTRNKDSRGAVWVVLAATAWLAGCVATPAPIVNHSFGTGQATAPAATATGSAAAGAQTFGLGNHAHGVTSAQGYTVARGDTLYSIAFAHGLDFRTLAADNDIAAPYTIHPGQVLKLGAAAAPAAAGAPVAAAAPAPTPVPTTTPPPAATPPSAPVFGPVMSEPEPAAAASASAPASAAATAVATPPPAVAPAPAPAPAPQAPPPAAAAPEATAGTATPPAGATRNAAGISWRWPATGSLISGFQAGSGGDGAGIDIAGKAGDPVRAAAAGTVVYSGNGLIGYGELVILKHNDTYLSAYGHNSKRLVKEGQHVEAGQEIALMGASGAPRVELHFEIRKNGKPVDPMGFLPTR